MADYTDARTIAFYGALKTCKDLLKEMERVLDSRTHGDWSDVADMNHIAKLLGEVCEFAEGSK